MEKNVRTIKDNEKMQLLASFKDKDASLENAFSFGRDYGWSYNVGVVNLNDKSQEMDYINVKSDQTLLSLKETLWLKYENEKLDFMGYNQPQYNVFSDRRTDCPYVSLNGNGKLGRYIRISNDGTIIYCGSQKQFNEMQRKTSSDSKTRTVKVKSKTVK